MTTFSPLAVHTVWTNKYSSRLGRKPECAILHHVVSTNYLAMVARLSGDRSGAKVSSHLVMGTDGHPTAIVPEEYRAWTTGSQQADGNALTIEHMNSALAPDYPTTEAALQGTARQLADWSKRYGWGKLGRHNVKIHQDFSATACPGPYIIRMLDEIINRANAILGYDSPAPAPNIRVLGQYRVSTNRLPLNGRAGPGTSYPVTMTAAKGYILSIVEIRNGWAKSTGGHWYSAQYLYKVGSGPAPAPTPVGFTRYQVVTRALPLNGRAGPGTGYRRTMTARKGTVLNIVEIHNGWARSTGGHWYSMRYLRKV